MLGMIREYLFGADAAENWAFIGSVAAVVLPLAAGLFALGKWLWTGHRRKEARAAEARARHGRTDTFPYQPLTPEEIFQHLRGVAGVRPKHVRRPQMADVRRRKPNGLLIWGPQGCGKSREAAEYAFARARELRGVQCFVIPGNVALQVPQDAPGFAMDAAVIVLDDLHKHWTRQQSHQQQQIAVGLPPGERICELLDYFSREAGAVVAIATVRREWWDEIQADPAMQPLLERLETHVELALVEGEDEEREYLREAAGARDLRVSNEVLDALVTANDGSFLAASEYFGELAEDNPGPREMTLAEAEGLAHVCARSWRQRVLTNLPKAQQEAVELACILSACQVPLRRVYLHALNRERTCSGRMARCLYRWRERPTLDRALDALARGPFPEEAGELRPHGSRLDETDRRNLLEEGTQVARVLQEPDLHHAWPMECAHSLHFIGRTLTLCEDQSEPALSYAVQCFNIAAVIYLEANCAEEWAFVQGSLGLTYARMSFIADCERNCDRSKSCAQHAVDHFRHFPHLAMPQDLMEQLIVTVDSILGGISQMDLAACQLAEMEHQLSGDVGSPSAMGDVNLDVIMQMKNDLMGTRISLTAILSLMPSQHSRAGLIFRRIENLEQRLENLRERTAARN